jgi:hypothetical protein
MNDFNPYANYGNFGDKVFDHHIDYMNTQATLKKLPEFAGQDGQQANTVAPPAGDFYMQNSDGSFTVGGQKTLAPTPKESLQTGTPDVPSMLTYRSNEQDNGIAIRTREEVERHNKTVEQRQQAEYEAKLNGGMYNKTQPQGRAPSEFEIMWGRMSPGQQQQYVNQYGQSGGGDIGKLQNFYKNQATAQKQLLQSLGGWDDKKNAPKVQPPPSQTSFDLFGVGNNFSKPNHNYAKEQQIYQASNDYTNALKGQANPHVQSLQRAGDRAGQSSTVGKLSAFEQWQNQNKGAK